MIGVLAHVSLPCKAHCHCMITTMNNGIRSIYSTFIVCHSSSPQLSPRKFRIITPDGIIAGKDRTRKFNISTIGQERKLCVIKVEAGSFSRNRYLDGIIARSILIFTSSKQFSVLSQEWRRMRRKSFRNVHICFYPLGKEGFADEEVQAFRFHPRHGTRSADKVFRKKVSLFLSLFETTSLLSIAQGFMEEDEPNLLCSISQNGGENILFIVRRMASGKKGNTLKRISRLRGNVGVSSILSMACGFVSGIGPLA